MLFYTKIYLFLKPSKCCSMDSSRRNLIGSEPKRTRLFMNTTLESHLVEILSSLHKNQNTFQVILASSESEAQKFTDLVKSLSAGFLSEKEIAYVPGYFQTGVYRYESSK